MLQPISQFDGVDQCQTSKAVLPSNKKLSIPTMPEAWMPAWPKAGVPAFDRQQMEEASKTMNAIQSLSALHLHIMVPLLSKAFIRVLQPPSSASKLDSELCF